MKIIQKNFKSSGKRVSSLMPQTIDDLKILVKHSEKMQNAKDMSLTIAKEFSVDRKSVSWLRENGLCLDNLQAAKSTLPHAGLGAFAQRSMSKGEIIIPVPLLQIEANETDLHYEFGDENSNFQSTQILINYCFGNKKSTLLFCPCKFWLVISCSLLAFFEIIGIYLIGHHLYTFYFPGHLRTSLSDKCNITQSLQSSAKKMWQKWS